jgi:hypothetical protein
MWLKQPYPLARIIKGDKLMIAPTIPFRKCQLSTWLLRSALVLATIVGSIASAAAQATHTTDTFVEPFDFVVTAAESCTGEDVHIFGIIEVLIQTTTDAKGGTHVSMQFVPFLTGEGLTSGLIYLPKGPLHSTDIVAPSGANVFSLTNVIRLIAPGSDSNLVITEYIHITVNPDGTTTVDFDTIRVACRG